MHRRSLVILLAMVTGLSLPSTARGQSGEKLASTLLDVIAASSVNAPDPNNVQHQAHFIPGIALTLAPRELNKAIATQLTTFPLPSSSGGFAYTTDPATGEIRLASSTFGPVFTERALTIGKRRVDVGVAFQPTSFDSFEGAGLSGGNINFYLEHNNCCPAGNSAPSLPTSEGPASSQFTPDFERDLLESSVSLDIETKTTVLYANYGVTDRLDLGVAVPFVDVQFGATVTSNIIRTATAASPLTHSFDGKGLATQTSSETRSASGLGDLLLRAKYSVVKNRASAIAAGIDLRVPSGDKDNLLGTGAVQTKLNVIVSGERGAFAPHASFGYTFSNGNVSDLTSTLVPPSNASIVFQTPSFDASVPDEVNYTMGLSAALHPRVTIGFDFVGRTVRDVFRFQVGNETFPNRAAGALPSASYVANNELLVKGDPTTGTPESLNLGLGAIGGKVNIGRGLLISAGVLFPLNDSGLKPKTTPYIGMDYVF